MKKTLYIDNNSSIVNPVIFNSVLCTGCNRCVESCQVDILIPNPIPKKNSLVLFPTECWYCGCCVMECPKPGAIKINPPLMNRVFWKRKKL